MNFFLQLFISCGSLTFLFLFTFFCTVFRRNRLTFCGGKLPQLLPALWLLGDASASLRAAACCVPASCVCAAAACVQTARLSEGEGAPQQQASASRDFSHSSPCKSSCTASDWGEEGRVQCVKVVITHSPVFIKKS